MSGSPSCPNTSISATVQRRPLGSVTTSRSRYCHSSMLHSGIFDPEGIQLLLEQLTQRSSDLRSSERFRNQQNSLGFSRTKTRIGKLGRVTDNSHRKFGMVRPVTHSVEKRFAHVKGCAIEDKRVGLMLSDQFVDGDGVARGEYFIARVAQRKSKKLGYLRRVVNEQDAAQA